MIKFNNYRQLKPFVKQLMILSTFHRLSYLQSPEIQLIQEHIDIKMLNKMFEVGIYDEHSKKVAISYLPYIFLHIQKSRYRNFKIKISPTDDGRRFVNLSVKFNERNYTSFVFKNNHQVSIEFSSDTLKTDFDICASEKIVNKWKITRCFPLCL